MKIAFVGKGGSGKTTLSSLFVRHLAARGTPVVAVDADINQHMGAALGLDDAEAAALPAMGAHLPLIKEYLRGSNPRIASAEKMIKTTPPAKAPGCSACKRTTRFTTLVRGLSHWTAEASDCWPRGRSPSRTWGWPATTPRRARWSCC